MKEALKKNVLVGVATLALAVPAVALASAEGGPSREEYVARVDPICEKNADANHRILKGVKEKVKEGKLVAAGNQFIRAAKAFGATQQKIAAVPQPPEDAATLGNWFDSLKVVQTTLGKIGKYLKKDMKIKATHETIKLRNSSNSANNISYVLEFHSCHLSPSQFF